MSPMWKCFRQKVYHIIGIFLFRNKLHTFKCFGKLIKAGKGNNSSIHSTKRIFINMNILAYFSSLPHLKLPRVKI